MKLAEGKAIDGSAFFDSISFTDLEARVQPRRKPARAVAASSGIVICHRRPARSLCGPLPVFQARQSHGECVVNGLAAAGGQLRGVLAAGQQRRGPFDGGLFCLGCPRPGPQPGAAEAVAYRGGQLRCS